MSATRSSARVNGSSTNGIPSDKPSSRQVPSQPPRDGSKAHTHSPRQADARSKAGSGTVHATHLQAERPSHKRTASGSTRPMSRTSTAAASAVAADGPELRRTERHTITKRDTIISRTKTTESRPSHGEKTRSSESTRETKAEAAATSEAWEPIATLRPHTTAPLASRISIPPTAAQNPVQPRALHDLSLEAQEAVILEDLLFVFMGFEGQYIRFAKGYDPSVERERLSGPTFRISSGLDPSLQDLTQSMLRMASNYSALEAFVDVQSRDEFGAVNHALCASIRKMLQEYLVLIAQLETQFLTSDSFTLHVLHVHVLPTGQMMTQLYALAHELLRKNALLDDESDDSDGGVDDYEQILENLRENAEFGTGNLTGKKLCKGGVVLGMIAKRLNLMGGDPSARALLTTLLRDASKPYMKMLNEWLHRGGIRDPHAEFLIKEQKSLNRERLEQDYTDEYWDRRYTIREKEVPPQLEAVKHRVLLAGKYLNVVRECGGVDISKEVKDVPMSFDDPRFLENVNHAYAHANASLMQMLLTTHELPARLRSMKHYFFLDPGDYFAHFLELGAQELNKPAKAVNTGKLQSLLDLVLGQPGGTVSLDPFKEDVTVQMNEITLVKSLQRVVNITGIEEGGTLQPTEKLPVDQDKNAKGYASLQLDYAVPFPVSLVVTRRTIWRYQALFRYLLSLRHLESLLSTNWSASTQSIAWTHRSRSPKIEAWKRRTWTLRARMLVFVQQLLYFCTAEVIEPNWQSLMSRLKKKKNGDAQGDFMERTVDELMQDHVDFLDTCLKECMLTNSKLLRIHSKLMNTCTMFTGSTTWMTRELERTDPDLTGTVKPRDFTPEQWAELQTTRQLLAAREAAAAAGAHNTTSASASSTSRDHMDRDQREAYMFEALTKWENYFGKHMQILLDALNHYAATETVVLLSLCARLSSANQGTEFAGLRSEDLSVV